MGAILQKHFLGVDAHQRATVRLAAVQSFGLTGATA
jgi:hypothetical protein